MFDRRPSPLDDAIVTTLLDGLRANSQWDLNPRFRSGLLWPLCRWAAVILYPYNRIGFTPMTTKWGGWNRTNWMN